MDRAEPGSSSETDGLGLSAASQAGLHTLTLAVPDALVATERVATEKLGRIARLRRAWPWRRIRRVAGRILGGLAIFYTALILLYAVVNPPFSVLMLTHWLRGGSVTQTWVPLEEISPNLVKAVIASEDGRYCEHWGVDWEAMADAWSAGNRGASTIPMQTSKNLFLGGSRTYVRKVLEIPFSYVTTVVWGKRRTMELYLNIAEWAPGIYGAEAAAQHHFKISAAKLSPYQAALLAASLPNPSTRKAGKPGPKTRWQAARVSRRMPGAGDYSACVLRQ